MRLPTLPDDPTAATGGVDWATALSGAPGPGPTSDPAAAPIPHVVAWNLTRRCNLACAHCYISAGSWEAASGELSTEACLDVVDQILEVNPSPLLILSGGEPLLREDLEDIARRASRGGATVVVGTNGTRLDDRRIGSLMAAGVTGVAVSVDSLRAGYHDRFRMAAARRGGAAAGRPAATPGTEDGRTPGVFSPHRHGAGALADTVAAVERLGRHGLDFIVQTTVTPANRDELAELAAWSAERGAVSFNVYFLVPTGRGEAIRALTPAQNDDVLRELVALEGRYRGRMMVRSKCQPQIMRHVVEGDPDSPLLNYRTRCPCGVHYLRITPEGKVTPCPYTPVVAGDLTASPFRAVWEASPVFQALRSGRLEGKCGRCEYREVCGGCRARAHAEGRGLLGADESCVYEPDGTVPVVRPRRPVTYGAPARAELDWTDDARARLARIPSFVRGVVTARVEGFARERGYEVVDAEVMAEVRRSLPVDFSKRLPFFLRNDRETGDEEVGA